MRTRKIAELYLKLLGVQQVLYSLSATRDIVMLWYWHAAPAEDTYRRFFLQGQVLGYSLLALLGGLLLIGFAGRIAKQIVGAEGMADEQESGFQLVSPRGFRFCVKLLGVNFMFDVVRFLAQGLTFNEPGPSHTWPAIGYEWTTFLRAILPFAFGAYLVLRGAWLMRLTWGKPKAQAA